MEIQILPISSSHAASGRGRKYGKGLGQINKLSWQSHVLSQVSRAEHVSGELVPKGGEDDAASN
jgi:hypothetical protein